MAVGIGGTGERRERIIESFVLQVPPQLVEIGLAAHLV